MNTTRAEHLKWCKQRALECLDQGKVAEAFASMLSDMRKHEETRDHPALELGAIMVVNGLLISPMEMRRFIEGFN